MLKNGAPMKHQVIIIVVLITMLVIVSTKHAHAEKPVKFYKEETTITLQEGSIQVQGLYFFENRSDFELDVSITYPFQVNTAQSFPENITLLDPRDPLPYEKTETGIQWSQYFEPSSIETVHVAYTQTVQQKQATYVLTRKFWNEKVDKIYLIIKAPLSFQNVSISIEPDTSKTDEITQFFYITKRYFKANQNLTISWE